MGAVMTTLALGTAGVGGGLPPETGRKATEKPFQIKKEDTLVMDTKLKIIEILEVGLFMVIVVGLLILL